MTPREAQDGSGGAEVGGSGTETGPEDGEAHTGAERVEVTAADRDRAERIVGSLSPWRDHLAAALAEERAKARAPFLALADELDATGGAEWREAWEAAADRIRRAAEESE